MNGCADCTYLGYPCPAHPCPCETDYANERVIVSPDCDVHGHLIADEPTEAAA